VQVPIASKNGVAYVVTLRYPQSVQEALSVALAVNRLLSSLRYHPTVASTAATPFRRRDP